MRPLRLLIDGFGSYRDRTELDLSDVDFFVLTGPTGSGKSTVIDALCFALYGTVPRWGKGNVIRNAMAPSTAECRVALVFEAFGGRYVAARQLRRDAKGQVHTKEARLDRLDQSVAADADLTEVLQAVVEAVAEGPDPVTEQVTALLGIGYDHFTQCVLLPQGRFAEFLHAKPSKRQDLLTELLAYGVYDEIGRRARERAKLAADRRDQTERRVADLGVVTDAELAEAADRVRVLGELVPRVQAALTDLDELRTRWTEASAQATEARGQVQALGAVHQPAGVAELAQLLAESDDLVRQRTAARDGTDAAETAVDRALAEHPDRTELLRWRDAHTKVSTVDDELAVLTARQDEAERAERELTDALAMAEQELAAAQAAVADAEREHLAMALVDDLREGEPCPVCRQPVGTLPQHTIPADLERARAGLKAGMAAVDAARGRTATAHRATATAAADAAAARRQRTELDAVLAGAPGPSEVDTSIAAVEAAAKAATAARADARRARTALDTAVSERSSLQDKEKAAWAELRGARDRFVALRVPAADGPDLAAAWQTLLDWAAQQRTALAASADRLTGAETALKEQGVTAAAALTGLLAEHGVRVHTAQDAAAELAAARTAADHALADTTKRHKDIAALTGELAGHRADAEVAAMLGNLLRSDNFERWLCAEALDSLVLEASDTLMQLSGGQFELNRGAGNELAVIDHNDAGTLRPVHTLSGGETFQASLALALALSRQVAGLSGGRRALNSMFLDEGFGTLDESTLDVVASTLERLSQDSNQVVGIVTHVPALAERVPVQFAVTRDGSSSRVRRVEVP